MKYDNTYVENLTRLSPDEQDSLARYYARLRPAARVEAHKRQRNFSTFWRNRHRDGNSISSTYDPTKHSENWYAGLLVSLQQIREIETAVERGRSLSKQELMLCSELRKDRITKKRQKNCPTRDLVVSRFHLIKTLREEGYSWRQIANYAEFRGKATYIYIRRIFLDEQGKRAVSSRLVASDCCPDD